MFFLRFIDMPYNVSKYSIPLPEWVFYYILQRDNKVRQQKEPFHFLIRDRKILLLYLKVSIFLFFTWSWRLSWKSTLTYTYNLSIAVLIICQILFVSFHFAYFSNFWERKLSSNSRKNSFKLVFDRVDLWCFGGVESHQKLS